MVQCDCYKQVKTHNIYISDTLIKIAGENGWDIWYGMKINKEKHYPWILIKENERKIDWDNDVNDHYQTISLEDAVGIITQKKVEVKSLIENIQEELSKQQEDIKALVNSVNNLGQYTKKELNRIIDYMNDLPLYFYPRNRYR